MRIYNCMITCSKIRTKFPLLIFILVTVSFFACRKNEDTVGADFLAQRNPLDLVDGIDTTTVVAFSAKQDSIAAWRNGTALSYYFIGEMNDPEIGVTKNSFISQYSIPINQFSFGGHIIDSAVYRLAIIPSSDYFYGNKNTVQKFTLYELTEDLRADSTYFSSRQFAYNTAKPLGSWEGTTAQLGDSVKVNNGTFPAHIRVRITDAEFLNKLQNAESNGAFINNTSFQTNFKGLVLVPENIFMSSGEGALIYTEPKSGLSGLAIYYDSSRVTTFQIKPENVRANRYEHTNKAGVDLLPVMNGTHQNITYCQPAGGIKTRITFPTLFDYVKDHQIAITGAQLIVTLKSGSNTAPYTQPANLRLLSADSLGNNNFLLDQLLGNADYYGGAYDASTGEYRFNIIRHLQNAINEYKLHNRNVNYGLNLIVPADNPLTGTRAILDNDRATKKIRLKLTYTVVK